MKGSRHKPLRYLVRELCVIAAMSLFYDTGRLGFGFIFG
jgi:hypothetical protein